ncbi:uncharacterized protein LOC125457615 isoform X2 [Stegostoma tigrinum]|uniref:uncharacterized protein LOC125457615 isoform X2 n=1 Tax=Stegostoma tigrinum TaxID=3053191 RepID=UPI0028702BF2|nr:uncharacterized protein LOC125457615 isoform X2 [Stegostoma tigrinum]
MGKIIMAYLTFFSKLLVTTGILGVVTDGEATVANQTNVTEFSHSASTFDPETNISTGSPDGENSMTNITVDLGITETSDIHASLTTGIYSNLNTSDTQSLNQTEENGNSSFPDNSSSSRTTVLIISTEPQKIPTTQMSDIEVSSTATITLITSTFKVSSTLSPYSSSVVPVGAANTLRIVLPLILIFILILFIIIIVTYRQHRKKHKYSFDLFHKTAEDADIPLSGPICPGAFEIIPDKADNTDVKKMNGDMDNHDKTPAVILNLPEEVNEKQNKCENETNHSPAKLSTYWKNILEAF